MDAGSEESSGQTSHSRESEVKAKEAKVRRTQCHRAASPEVQVHRYHLDVAMQISLMSWAQHVMGCV